MSRIPQFLIGGLFLLLAMTSGLAQAVTGSGTPNRIPKWVPSNDPSTTSRIADSIIAEVNGKIGISDRFPGIGAPGEKLTLLDGNFFMESGDEVSIKIKRDIMITGPSGVSNNPVFQFGRIIQAGDGDPEVRFLYSDDDPITGKERSVFEFDRKGIVASVKPEVGSHFEGFIPASNHPVFRLNSFPKMRLEMGDGLTQPERDVAIQREAAATLTFLTRDVERVRIDAGGNVGIGITNPEFPLDVAGRVRATKFVKSSDARLKMNVVQLLHVLEKLEKVRGVSFDWKQPQELPSYSTGQREIGVIGQEVEAVFPELVIRSGDQGYRAVDYGSLTAVLIEAIKELRAEKDDQIMELQIRVAAQHQEIVALQEQNAAFADRLAAIERMAQPKARRETRTRN